MYIQGAWKLSNSTMLTIHSHPLQLQLAVTQPLGDNSYMALPGTLLWFGV